MGGAVCSSALRFPGTAFSPGPLLLQGNSKVLFMSTLDLSGIKIKDPCYIEFLNLRGNTFRVNLAPRYKTLGKLRSSYSLTLSQDGRGHRSA